ncbi:hypothetical protein J3U75_09270 [Snodgrassella sp. B3088]|uniref:hypothetical protein n=1 Tax=Snodgrassella sp. B3088 TaxID=2818038 RepID=UPI00226AA1F3|nr:hypothetical protein [Snodgrassella sp. B3088]MCX8749558.1 hypothetical protein [Snodgrassella sp. B3088]
MVINEKLIKFPIPNWNRIINPDLDSMAYCLCYQYNINCNGYGPYGFNTYFAKKIILKTFPNLMYLDKQNSEFISLKHVENIQRDGIYLYGDKEKLDLIYSELNKYYLIKKKNEMKSKKKLSQEPLPSKPLLLDLIEDNKYKSEVIKKILHLDYKILISHHYMPEAGQTCILFEQNILLKIKEYALYYNVPFVETSSIDQLKAW